MATKVAEVHASSLPVPCVQELAKEPLATVPKRYIRYQEPPLVASTCPEVPTISMENLLHGDPTELNKLDSACKEWGFFQLKDHGVSSSLLKEVELEYQNLFNLPMEEKKKLWQIPGDVEGFGGAFIVSEEQKLNWVDMFYLSTLPPNMRKPYLFPKLPLPLRDTLEAYAVELQQLAMKILDFMAKALKIKGEEMRELFEGGMQSMRTNYYPPCPQPELVTGLSAHSDSVGLTILLQVNEMEGLQIKKNGMWIPVKPYPETFVVNLGDILEMVTNGAYRSIEHRAVVNSEKERLSIATFYSPRVDVEMGPVPSLITPQTPPLFKRIVTAEYFNGLFAREIHGKSYLDTLRIENESRKS